MIAIIADDFTGAAELAGIALRYGLTVELCMDEVKYKNAAVLVVSTDSRSLNKEAALERTAAVVNAILKLEPAFIYKKIDSVLRGYVVDELKLQMELMQRQRAMILTANPLLGRTIVNGEYFVNGVRINETGFVNDPEFPVSSSFVKEILNNAADVIQPGQPLPEKGIAVAEAAVFEDYSEWAAQLDESWVLAGAGDFFTAWLNKNHHEMEHISPQLQNPFLHVCGTAFNERKEAIKKIAAEKQTVCYIKNENGEDVLSAAAAILNNKEAMILAFDDATEFKASASALRQQMALLTKRLVEKNSVKELFIEGGSTAAAVLEEMNIKKLTPVNELSRGVVRMKAGDLYITVKPGSYQLPVEIKALYISHG
jgi:D-threonate/D-erythronate kinase